MTGVRGGARQAREPLLLTPGPLTTSPATRQAMLRDWGSRDAEFAALTARVLRRLEELADPGGACCAVLLQGSGTFAVEAMIGTFVPAAGKLLVLANGAYGRRIAEICRRIGRAFQVLETPEDAVPDPDAVGAALESDRAVTHVALVHCETTSGILNPLAEIGRAVASAGRRLLVDAMSSFGALPCRAADVPFDAAASSCNKCLEGVPGAAFVVCRRTALEGTAGNAHSLALDLHDQWRAMQKTGQWRFTPPTHVMAAFDRALAEHAAEGGVSGRGGRYRRNCRVLVDGMAEMGFRPMLPSSLQSPIIVTFPCPRDARFRFETFYDLLRRRGYLIYPGKLTALESFRIGCIGRVTEADMRGLLEAVRAALGAMGVGVPVAAGA
jgi:2-aminoethylphosphonate-pyruvate transaminase